MKLKYHLFSCLVFVATFIATIGVEPASWLTWYEPQMPAKLLKDL